jgi:hypothetical protein
MADLNRDIAVHEVVFRKPRPFGGLTIIGFVYKKGIK